MKGLALLIAKAKKPKSEKADEDEGLEEPESEEEEDAEDHGRAILDAIKADDPKGLVEALRACYERYG